MILDFEQNRNVIISIHVYKLNSLILSTIGKCQRHRNTLVDSQSDISPLDRNVVRAIFHSFDQYFKPRVVVIEVNELSFRDVGFGDDNLGRHLNGLVVEGLFVWGENGDSELSEQ